jgi:hypothetical protein
MRPVRNFAVLLALVACSLSVPLRSNGQSADLPDATPLANIGAGSAIVANVEVLLPANEGMVYLQNGAFTTWQQLTKTSPSCRLYTGPNPQVRKLVPGRKLIVTGTMANAGGTYLYGDVLLFEDDDTIGQLQCTAGRKGNITIGELKSALGGLFSLVQAPPVVG